MYILNVDLASLEYTKPTNQNMSSLFDLLQNALVDECVLQDSVSGRGVFEGHDREDDGELLLLEECTLSGWSIILWKAAMSWSVGELQYGMTCEDSSRCWHGGIEECYSANGRERENWNYLTVMRWRWNRGVIGTVIQQVDIYANIL